MLSMHVPWKYSNIFFKVVAMIMGHISICLCIDFNINVLMSVTVT